MCACVCVVCLCVRVSASACRDEKRVSEPVKLEFQRVLSSLVWMLGTEFRCSSRNIVFKKFYVYYYLCGGLPLHAYGGQRMSLWVDSLPPLLCGFWGWKLGPQACTANTWVYSTTSPVPSHLFIYLS